MADWLSVEDIGVRFRLKSGQALQALHGITFGMAAGEALGVVGESGCGKSTLARLILQLEQPTAGTVLWQGKPLSNKDQARLRAFRRAVQCIFQDPLDALNPRLTVGESIAEPLQALRQDLGKTAIHARVGELLHAVGLEASMQGRYPHEFSGGQCQRVGIARALAVEPQLLVCDEPVSALDRSIQQQVVELLQGLRQQRQLGMLFISHDFGVVRQLCGRVLVLYLGRIMELADTTVLYRQPMHPYTRLLLDAIPLPDPQRERERLAAFGQPTDELPSPLHPPAGCVFHPRCPQAQARCRTEVPALRRITANRQVACHFPLT